MALYEAAAEADVPEGGRVIVTLEGRSIGVYRIDGEYYAIHNYCPHEGAELCKGHIHGTTLPSNVAEFEYGREGQIVRCPWHGWEFDIKSGRSLFSDKVRTRSYKVEVLGGMVYVAIGKD
ncbi:Rieske (2Fe-2S) protein [Paenibacillus sp. GCM10023252]|uniref:Rieske (2Fe-2S) protein n=1 Tax=Paenibacillus sp. GCM10023252 TaxID=3252649 RepID=UPI00361C2248